MRTMLLLLVVVVVVVVVGVVGVAMGAAIVRGRGHHELVVGLGGEDESGRGGSLSLVVCDRRGRGGYVHVSAVMLLGLLRRAEVPGGGGAGEGPTPLLSEMLHDLVRQIQVPKRGRPASTSAPSAASGGGLGISRMRVLLSDGGRSRDEAGVATIYARRGREILIVLVRITDTDGGQIRW